jgi:hypothetical protein
LANVILVIDDQDLMCGFRPGGGHAEASFPVYGWRTTRQCGNTPRLGCAGCLLNRRRKRCRPIDAEAR